MPARVLTAAVAAIVVGILLYVFFLVPTYPSTEGIHLEYPADQDAARADAGDDLTRVTGDDLAAVPKIRHMLDLALGQSPPPPPPPPNADGSSIWGAEQGYRVEIGSSENGDIYVMADLSFLDEAWYEGWIGTNVSHGYLEYEGGVFLLGQWYT